MDLLCLDPGPERVLAVATDAEVFQHRLHAGLDHRRHAVGPPAAQRDVDARVEVHHLGESQNIAPALPAVSETLLLFGEPPWIASGVVRHGAGQLATAAFGGRFSTSAHQKRLSVVRIVETLNSRLAGQRKTPLIAAHPVQ